MNIFSKSYSGKFYVIAAVISAIVAGLTSDAVGDLGWEWTGPAVVVLNALLFLIQQFTSIGDTE